MTDPALRPAVDLLADLARGEVGARELLEHYLRRVERLNPALNAVVTLDVEGARRAADAADAARARGQSLGALHGLPMTVKDTLETAGVRTTAGAPVLADHVPARDATAVARLDAAVQAIARANAAANVRVATRTIIVVGAACWGARRRRLVRLYQPFRQ